MSKVSVIVTTWDPENKKYLDACIASVKNLDYPNLEIILVGRKSYQPQYEGVKTIAPDSDEFWMPVGMNFGFKNASPDSKYFLYLNDDCICTKNSLKNLVNAVGDNPIMANAISPCDNMGFYFLMFSIQVGKDVLPLSHRFYRYEDLEKFIPDMMNSNSHYQFGAFYMPWLCIFATLIPRSVYELIGDFDESLIGHDDYDYSLRAKEKNVGMVACLDSLIYHFGGATTDKTLSKVKKESLQRFFAKWGSLPPGAKKEDMT